MLYEGFLSVKDYGEATDLLFLSTEDEPLAEVLDTKIRGKQVTVRYWIANKECSREAANEAFMEELIGKADTEYQVHYSEVTGYLWTDEEIKIGGHDLLEELSDNVGKYLILEVEVHDPLPAPNVFSDLIGGLKHISGKDDDFVNFFVQMKVGLVKRLIEVLENNA